MGVGILAGLSTGLVVLGIGGRIAMRVIALAEGAEPEFSLGGTAIVLLALTLMPAPCGALFATLSIRLPGRGPVKGAVFGTALVLVVLAAAMARAGGEVELSAGTLTGAGLFGALIVAWGAALPAAIARWDRVLPAPRRHPGVIAAYVLLMAAGGFGLFMWMPLLFGIGV